MWIKKEKWKRNRDGTQSLWKYFDTHSIAPELSKFSSGKHIIMRKINTYYHVIMIRQPKTKIWNTSVIFSKFNSCPWVTDFHRSNIIFLWKLYIKILSHQCDVTSVIPLSFSKKQRHWQKLLSLHYADKWQIHMCVWNI